MMMYRLTSDKPPVYMWVMYSRERDDHCSVQGLQG